MPIPSAPAAPTLSPSRLTRAVLLACLSLGLGATATIARAQASAQGPVHHEIPAGPLDDVLTRFAAAAGVPLTIDGQLTAGKRSAGLSGSFGVRDGLDRILAGSGLSVAEQPGGGYALVKAPVAVAAAAGAGGEAALPVIQVRSQATLEATTEGTGSYTTGATSASTGLNLSLRETPQSVTVVTRQRIEDQGLTQMMELVQNVAGLTVSQGGNAGSDSSTIYSRGFAVENYLIDGVGQNYSNYSSIFQTNDLVIFDRVEVVRGASGLMNGIGSPGASINLVRKKPTAAFQASGRVEVGSWNYYRGEADVSDAINEAGTLRGRAVAAVQDNDSYIDRLNEKRKVLYGIIEADVTPDTLVTAGVSIQHHDATGHARGGRPFFAKDGSLVHWARSDSAAANWGYSERHNSSVFASLEHRFESGWSVKGTAIRSESDYDERLGYAAGGNLVPGTGSGISLYGSGWEGTPVQETFDVRATGPFEAFGRKHELVVGASTSRTQDVAPDFPGWSVTPIPDIYNWDGNTPAAPVYAPRGTQSFSERLTSAFAAARLKPTDALSVILGARVTDWRNNVSYVDTAGVQYDSSSRAESGEITPFAGVVYDISPHWSAYASYTSIFKPQNNQAVDGSYLDPVLGNTWETGVKGAFFDNQLNVSAAIYRIQLDNFGVVIPGEYVGGDLNKPAYRAESGTLSRGFELEVSGALTPAWQMSAAFARNLAQTRDGGPLDTSIPANTFKLFSTYKLASVGNGLTLGGGVRWQSEIYSERSIFPGGGAAPIPVRFTQEAYAVVDLMARYQITRNLGASVNLNNAFDKSYHMSTWNSYYGTPRELRAALDVKF